MKITRISAFSILLCAMATPDAFGQTEAEIASKFPGYTLAFRDEFNTGDKPDPTVWSFETGFCRNHEAQYYQRDNAYIADGNLVIEARKERVENAAYRKGSSDWKTKDRYAEYTSSSLIAKDPYRFNMGIYEVRAKIPVGTGYWPAIWSCGSKFEWPYNGEIDVMEYYRDAIHANVAWGTTTRWQAAWNSKAPRMSTFEADFAEKYHTWRMEWTYETIKIYIDDRLLNSVDLDQTINGNPGQSFFNLDNYNPYRDPEQLHGVWLNLALGGDNGGSLTDTPFPAKYYIDYVRVYLPSDGAKLDKAIADARAALDNTAEGDAPGQFPAQARRDLEKAIADAEAIADDADDDERSRAAQALDEAVAAYNDAIVRLGADCPFSLRESNSGLMFATGKFTSNNAEVHGAVLHKEDAEGFCNKFVFKAVPEGAQAEGFNLMTEDGKYLYCEGNWNLRVADTPAELTGKRYIFDMDYENGKAMIRCAFNSRHIGFDSTAAGSELYSDKTGASRCVFSIITDGSAAINDVIADRTDAADAVYNLQGIRVADTINDIPAGTPRRVYIVVSAGRSSKVVL